MTPIDLDAHVGDLSWADVDPSRTLAPDRARALSLAVDALMSTPRDDTRWRTAAFQRITRAFAHAWGPWTCGWSWARNGGGVVSSWCCASHSLCPEGDADPIGNTAARAADALLEWRGWLDELRALFARVDAVAAASGRADVSAPALATAAAHIVDAVVARTGAEDAWYFHCGQVLGWYLEHAGVEASRVPDLVERAIGGRFESWIAPGAEARHEVAEAFGATAAGVLVGARANDEEPRR